MALESRTGALFACMGFLAKYAVAVGAVGAAYTLFLLIPALSMTPLGLFTTAVAAVAVYGGYGPGLLAALLSTAAACGLVAPSLLTIPGVAWTAGVLGAVALLVAWLSEARRCAEEAKQHWETVVEASGDAIFSKDLHGTITAWNRAAADLYGYEAEEMVGSSVARLIPEDRRHELEEYLSRLRRGERVSSAETERLTRDGRRLWVRLSLSPIFDRQGRPVGGSVICHDITARKRAEEALLESEERFRSIVTDAPIPIVVHTVEGKALAVSRAFTRVTGYTIEDVPDAAAWLQKACQVPPEDLEAARRLLRAKCETVACYAKEEHEIVTKSGERRTWISHASRPQSASNGQRVMASMAVDITERKEAERGLRETRDMLQTVLDAAPAGVILADAEGRILFASAATERILGAPISGDAHGPDRGYTVCTPDGTPIPRGRLPLSLALAGQHVVDTEIRVTRADGSHTVILATATPLRDERGEIRGAVTVFLDIHDRKKTEEALRTSEERYRTLFSMMDEGFCVVEMIFGENGQPVDYRFLETNASFEKQTGLVDARGKTMRELAPCHEEHWFETYGEVAMTGRPVRFQSRVEQLGRWYDVYAFRFDRPERRQVAILFSDITERKRTEEALQSFAQTLEARVADRTAELERSYAALRQSERLATLGQAMAALSHESRNAVQNCMAALQMLRRLVEHEPKQLHYVEMGLASLENLRGSYEDIRDYAAPMRLERADTSLPDVWRKTWAELGARRAGRDARLLEAAECLDFVCGVDALRLKQVFRNLMENSLDACSDPVEILIACEETVLEGRPAIHLRVRDNGPGIAPEMRERLLDPFVTTKTKGTGLGLAIVRRIVEAHGGRIALGGDEGQGLLVAIDLPRNCRQDRGGL